MDPAVADGGFHFPTVEQPPILMAFVISKCRNGVSKPSILTPALPSHYDLHTELNHISKNKSGRYETMGHLRTLQSFPTITK